MRALLYWYFLTLLLPGVVNAQTPPLNTSAISIVSAAYTGNGCPQGSLSTSFSPDKTIITLTFTSLPLYLGPGTPTRDKSKNCQIRLHLNYPQKTNFIIQSTTWHGYLTLPSDVRAAFYTAFEFYSRDTQVTNVPVTIVNGTDSSREQLFHQELGVINELSSMCSSRSTSEGGASDIIVVYDRWALTALRSDVSVVDGWMAEGVPLVQQIKLRWQECNWGR